MTDWGLIPIMKKMTILLAMVVAVACSRAEGGDWDIPSEKEKFHVFILMGQSNMAGGIPGKELTKEDKTPVPHIVLRRGRAWIPAAHPLHLGGKKNGFGLGLPFAEEYLKNHPGVTVGLVPCASRGKRIDLLKKGSNIYRAAMGKTKLALETGTIKAILWHQGESDTVTDERADSYEEKLHQLIADVRKDLGSPDLPFIVGDLGQLYGIGENNLNPDPAKVARIKEIRDALKGVLKKVKNTGFVETTGLTYSDAPKCTHFDRESYITLGRRYCGVYGTIIENENVKVTTDRSESKASEPLHKALSLIEAGKEREAAQYLDAGWVDRFSPPIRDSVPGPFLPGYWGFSRARGNKVYLFIRNWQPGNVMQLPNGDLPIKQTTCRALTGGRVRLKWPLGTEIFMDRSERDPVTTVVEYQVEGNAERMHKVHVPDWRDPSLNASEESIAAWRKLKFGLFVHWGPCTVGGIGISWKRDGSKMGRLRKGGTGVNGAYKADSFYDNLYKEFRNENFDAEQWALTAKEAGMKYMVVITKHHDGFCMFDSKVMDYDIMSTPYGKDTAKQLADACHKHGIKLGWYYSPRDWYQRDFGQEATHHKYCELYLAQLRELCTNYGRIDILWFDCLDSPQYLWKTVPEESVRLIRKLQPDIVINDRSGLRGDFDTAENHVGPFERERPWESCMTIARGWSWRASANQNPKPLQYLIQQLVTTVGRDGNLLLGLGPKPDGTFEPKQVARLKEIGAWLKKNGESIYGTRGGPFISAKDFASSCKGNTIYLHLLNKRREVVLPEMKAEVESVSILNGGPIIPMHKDANHLIRIDDKLVDPIDTIIVITTNKSAESMKPAEIVKE